MDITYDKLKDILEKHKIWIEGGEGGSRADLSDADLRYANLIGADLIGADLSGADLDYSTWPLWCGSLTVGVDDRLVYQLLYHTLSVVKHSPNVSEELKKALLTQKNLDIALAFHRADECKKLDMEDARDGN